MEQTITGPDGERFSITRPEDRDETPRPALQLVPAVEQALERDEATAAVNYETMPLEALAEACVYTDERIAHFRRCIDEATLDRQGLHHELYRRMAENSATALPHQEFEISYERKKSLEKNEAAFAEIPKLDFLSQKEVDEMIRLVPQEPVLRTDATALKKFAKKYGGALNDILAKALVYVDGPIKVTVKRKQEEL